MKNKSAENTNKECRKNLKQERQKMFNLIIILNDNNGNINYKYKKWSSSTHRNLGGLNTHESNIKLNIKSSMG